MITHPKKLTFLENYPKFKTTKATTEAIGIREATPYDWIKTDEVFAVAFAALKKEIEAHLIELHEANIDDIALNIKTPPQSRIFGSLVRLRAAWPEKYRENAPESKFVGEITIKMAIPEYDDSLRLVEKPIISIEKEVSNGQEGTGKVTEAETA